MRKRKENFLRSGVAVALAAIAFATGIDRLMVKREVMSGDSSAGMLATLVCQEGGKVEALPDYAFLSMGHALTDRFVTLDNLTLLLGWGTASSLVKISNNVVVCLSLLLAGSYKSFIITINSFNMELTKDDREKLDS